MMQLHHVIIIMLGLELRFELPYSLHRWLLRSFKNKLWQIQLGLCHVQSNIWYQYIQHKWIVLFARFDWFLNLGISSTIHLLAASGRKKMARETHFIRKYSNYLGIAINLVLYILKQLFASVSVNSGGYLPRRSGSVNIHRYSPPLRRIIVK